MNGENPTPDQLLLALGFSNVPLPVMGRSFDSMHANCLTKFPTDPGFVERAARYSCFSSAHVDGEFGSGKEDSSVTDPAFGSGESNGKKRKVVGKRKVKVAEEHVLSAKKCRGEEEHDVVDEKKDGEKEAEPFKDYIHVRARRGQATDSHSLAERVRREKISQRMKLLQDLVPGCNKITGKAPMLDEIINYVQALQRQVEFLSMKLATVNIGLDFNLQNLISKETFLNQANPSLSSSIYPMGNLPLSINFGQGSNEGNNVAFSLANGIDSHCSIGQLDSVLNQAAIMQTALEMFGASVSQAENLWDDELHNVLQSSYGNNQEIGANSQNFHGQMLASNMKIEL